MDSECFLPGIVLTPASTAICFDFILSPMANMADSDGPTNVTPICLTFLWKI